MLYERIDPNFQPSATTIASCLWVRKQGFSVSGIKHPGLHGLHGVAWDVTAVLFVVVAELSGMFMLYSLLQTSNYPASQLFVGAFVLIAVDFALAISHHLFKTGTVTKLKAQILLLGTDGSPEEKKDCESKKDSIWRRILIANMFAFLIVIFAVLKFMIYVGLTLTIYGYNLPVQYIALAFVLYSVTAVLHIKSTGYFVMWRFCSFWYQRDVRKFKKSGGTQCCCPKTPHVESLPDCAEFKSLKPVESHSVELNPSPPNPAEPYVLKAVGLLLDSEVKEFVDQMVDDEAKRKFTLKALALQLSYLH